MFAVGCASTSSPTSSPTSFRGKAWAISDLHVMKPPEVPGTIKRIAVVPSIKPGRPGPDDSLEKEIRMRVEQIVFDLSKFRPRLEVVERSNLDAAIREIQFQLSGLVRDEELVRLGQMV